MSSNPLPMLLTRPGCHLCEEVAATLRHLGIRFATIDIESDPALEEVYGDAIPVLLLGDRELGRAPLSKAALRRLLRAGGSGDRILGNE